MKVIWKKPQFWLGLVLSLAAFLRFYRLPAYMEFLGDQGRDVLVVWRFLTRGDLMFIGPQTSVGNMYLGPWYYYLIAPFLWLFHFSPVGPAVLVAFLGLGAVWLIWWVTKEWFAGDVGLIAALLMAVSPVVVYYSIFSWNPNIMPFFALLSMWLLWRIWQRHEYRKLIWLAVSLAMVLNSHYLGLLLLPVVGLFWLWALKDVWHKREERKRLAQFSVIAILIFLFFLSPLVLFDLKHNFANARAFEKFFAARQTTVNFKFYKGFLRLPVIFNQLYSQLLVRQDYWQPAFWFLPLLLWGIWRERKNKAIWLLVLWLVVGLLGLANYKQHVYAHYYGFLWPAAIVLLAISLKHLWWFLRWPILVGLVGLSLWHWHGRYPPNYQLARAQKVANFILDKSRGDKFALALIAEQNYDAPYRYFFLLRKAPLVELHQEMPRQLFVICEPWGKVNCNPIGHPKWQIAAFGWAKIDRQWEVSGVKIFRLVHLK